MKSTRLFVLLGLLCYLLAPVAQASLTVSSWRAASASRILFFCVADALIDLPATGVPDGAQCYVIGGGTYSNEGGVWTLVAGSGGVTDGDKGDVTVSAGGTAWAIDPDSVALGTDTTGNYVSGVTANQGVLLTGTEGASVGLIDCAATQIIKRNAGDTEWECAADSGGGDSITVNSGAATDPDFLNGDIDWTLSGGNSITATVGCSGCVDITDLASDSVGEPELKAVDAASDEECLTYETTTGDFEWQACGGGASIILDIGDDAGNDSTALSEIATVSDDYSVLTESSADKALIDFAKIPPYRQYDPNRPPSSCAACDEFTSGTSLTWNTSDGLDGGSATAEFSGYTIAHSGTNETMAVWTDSPSSGNTDFTVTVKVIQSGVASTDGCGIAFLAAGTTASPTDIRMVWEQTGTGFGFVVGSTTSYTAAPSAASTETTKVSTVTINSSTTYLQARYIDSTRAITGWYSYDGTHFFQIGASSTTASADPAKWGLMMRDDPTCVFAWARARTDANKNYAGE